MTELMPAASRAAVELEALGARIAGAVVLPGAECWDEARLAWNLAVDQRPDAVVFAEGAGDVVEVVRSARAAGLRVAPQGTGHGAAPLGDLAGTILLKTERMRAVSIDPEARIARAEAGVLWLEVVERAVEHGLTALHGSAPDVGVVGYTLGGGIGWLARKHGLAANSVTAIEVVTGTGELVRADARTSRSSSGRSAGAAATTASSPRSSSASIPSASCSQASSSSPSSGRPRCSARGGNGSRPSPRS